MYMYIYIRSICRQQLFRSLGARQYSSDQMKILYILYRLYIYIYIYIKLDNRIYSYAVIYSYTVNVNLILICIELSEM